MVDALLSLAKVEAGGVSARMETIRLKELLEEQWRNFSDKAFDRKLVFENRVGDEVVCVGDKDHLGMMVSNVLDNAVGYCDEGGRMWCAAVGEGERVVLSVSNTGARIREGEAGFVFDAFWRHDKARGAAGDHCGIGLAVVRKMARVLGITVEAEIESPGVVTVRFELPGGVAYKRAF